MRMHPAERRKAPGPLLSVTVVVIWALQAGHVTWTGLLP